MIPLIFPNGPQMVDSYRNPLDVLGGEFLVMNVIVKHIRLLE